MVVSADADPALATTPATASSAAAEPATAQRVLDLITDLITCYLLTVGESVISA
jgi:hypothetical protein